ncbi:MAG TPA: glycosyltransferase N-terminal domain-containing protein, partial [Candidatus Melainabacteria bacterium]|nr:glycosyltransferase N-terminal domain-containing protein [Candidatus Melainabacteria bacterium]
MTFIYQIGLAIALIFVGPVLLLRKKTRAGIFEKLGFVPRKVKESRAENKGCIWIHAVSVGEFNAAYPLVKKLKEELPTTPIAISTSTATGQSIAREKAGDIATIFYFPFDLPFCMKPWFEALDPA